MFKKTPFYGKHVEAGGKIVPFAGFEMPIQFKGILHEVKRVRSTVGIFDVSHMGRVEIHGPNAMRFVSELTTNDPYALNIFQAQYSCMCYPNGGIVDDLIVYRLPDKFLLVINAANREKDYQWMIEHKLEGIEIVDVSDEIAQLAVQGPMAEPTMQPLVDIDLSKMKYYWGANGKVAGVHAFISRTGYTGEDGFEIYFSVKYASEVWDKIVEAGRSFDIESIGLGARDTLRLEMKYCLYGNDIDETTNPLEAGLGWITKLNKPNFVGKEAIVRQKEEGLKRKLVGFVMKSKAIPRQHYKIFKQGRQIGEVTSGNFSPSINQPIGLGYVKIPYDEVNTEIEIDCREKLEPAKIIKPPFYTQRTHK
ncbi:MAG: glycine cleavage system aminomethyltransferase GcvT [bacterium]|nr:glycine cleavage system aminomethyltransferase GcvT [bacterium]